MFNTTAKTNIFGFTPGQEYTAFKVAPNGMDASSSFFGVDQWQLSLGGDGEFYFDQF